MTGIRIFKITKWIFRRMDGQIRCYTCGKKIKTGELVCSSHVGKQKTYRHEKCAKKVCLI